MPSIMIIAIAAATTDAISRLRFLILLDRLGLLLLVCFFAIFAIFTPFLLT